MCVERLLEVVQSQVGVDEEPHGSNRGRRVNEYLKSTGLGGGYPWCAAFVAWCGLEAFGSEWPLPRTAGCDALLAFAKKNGILRMKPEVGDVFLCMVASNDSTHTGFVVGINEDGKSVRTVEGNSNSNGSAEGYEVAARPSRTIDPPGKRFLAFIRWQDLMQGEEPWRLFLNTDCLGEMEMVEGTNFFEARKVAEALFGKASAGAHLGWDNDARTITWKNEPLPTVSWNRSGTAWCPVRGLANSFGLEVKVDAPNRCVVLTRA